MQRGLVAVVLPMYNEELSIPDIRLMFDEDLLLPAGCETQLIVVNDGSKDQTLELVDNWSRENQKITVVSHIQNMGLGQAILTGFNEALRMGADFIVVMDADASHSSRVIGALIQKIIDGADIAIASRFASGSKQSGVPFLRNVYSLGAKLLLSLVFPLRGVRDYTIGFRAYRASLVYAVLEEAAGSFLTSRSFAANAEILLKMAGKARKIEEVPFVLRYDCKKSPSKLRLWSTIRDYMRICFLPKQPCLLGRALKI
ncbi:MAG: glycosyltransferase [Syntrophomonadaceae bacterium]|nr:glycosyltransferase [Syntrophomonadaceae bacterium]